MMASGRMMEQRLGVSQTVVEWRWWRTVYQGASLVMGWRRGKSVSSMLSLYVVRVRSHLPCRLTLVASSSLLSLQYFPGERSPVTHSVAVSELSVLPLRQRAAVAEL